MSGLVTQDWQWEFDGLLFGNDTPYQVTQADGFLDLSGVRANFTPRARAHGGFTEPHFGGGAVLDLTFNVSATPTITYYAAMLALEAGTYPQAATRPIWWQTPGHPLLTMQVQCLRRSIPVDQNYGFGLVQGAAVQFYAPNPLKYAAPVTVATFLDLTSPGLPFPMSFPLAFGAPSTGRVSTANPGSAPTSPIFTITGPVDTSGFVIVSIEDGATITYNGSLGATDSLTIDTSTGFAVLNGASAVTVSASAWPLIPAATFTGPGVRTYQFSVLGAFSPLSSMRVSYSPAYW